MDLVALDLVALDLVMDALRANLEPYNFALLLLGSALGLLVGVLPGLSSPMAIAVLIPVTYGMAPLSAMMVLVGVYVGVKTGGAYSAILLRTPGTPAAAATALEGYPMARRGEAGRALGLAIGASFVGGTLSFLVALSLVGVIGRYAVRISAADLAMIGILALMMVASLSGREVLKGLMAACIGLIASTVGLDAMTGVPRLTFGHYQLMGGLSFLAAIIGLFAVATVLTDVPSDPGASREPRQSTTLDLRRLVADLWRMRASIGTGSVIGALLGLVPGAGSDTAGWLAYASTKKRWERGGKARRASPHADRAFGEGVPEGVVGPEAANNAVTGGAFVPMLTLGIPGDGSTAVMLGALMLYGLQPGPLFFAESPDVAYGVLMALGLANLTTLVAAIVLIRAFVAVLYINRMMLLAGVLALALIGAYASTNATFEMLVAIGFGALGYVMARYRFSLPAMALAIVLGPLIEANFRRALLISRGDASVFLTSPLSALCILVMLGVAAKLVWDTLAGARTARRAASETPAISEGGARHRHTPQ